MKGITWLKNLCLNQPGEKKVAYNGHKIVREAPQDAHSIHTHINTPPPFF